jgi:hypothetical protein
MRADWTSQVLALQPVDDLSDQGCRDAATPIVGDRSDASLRIPEKEIEETYSSKLMEQIKARPRLYIQGSDTVPRQSSETPRTTIKELAMRIGIRGFAGIVGVASLVVIVLACGSGAGPDEAPIPASPTAGGATPTASNPPTSTEIGRALEAAEGSEVTVSGHLIADSDGNARLCGVLAESLPPQCGGDRIDLLGFDASSVPNSKTPQRPSEIQTARWTDRLITVTGIKGIGGLAEVRLSSDTPPAANLGGTGVAPPAPAEAPAPAGMGMMAPNLRLTFDGVEYTGVEILGATTPNGPIVCCGTPINMDDMEVVATGIQHNPDGDASIQVYRPKTGATTDVYTFHTAQTVETSGEPGGTATAPAT